MIKEVQVVVIGDVVGVGFRAYVKAQALPLALTGYAANVGRGRVEVVGQGDELKLQIFLKEIRRGPLGGRIDSFDVSWHQPTVILEEFEIR